MYGASVPSTHKWIASNKTFYPGPAFWKNTSSLEEEEEEEDIGGDDTTTTKTQKLPLVTSSVLAPPIAADVAWQIFRLSPYDTSLGVVSYKTNAVRFLCDAYEPLKKLQTLLLETRAVNYTTSSHENANLLLAAHVSGNTLRSLLTLIAHARLAFLLLTSAMCRSTRGKRFHRCPPTGKAT